MAINIDSKVINILHSQFCKVENFTPFTDAQLSIEIMPRNAFSSRIFEITQKYGLKCEKDDFAAYNGADGITIVNNDRTFKHILVVSDSCDDITSFSAILWHELAHAYWEDRVLQDMTIFDRAGKDDVISIGLYYCREFIAHMSKFRVMFSVLGRPDASHVKGLVEQSVADSIISRSKDNSGSLISSIAYASSEINSFIVNCTGLSLDGFEFPASGAPELAMELKKLLALSLKFTSRDYVIRDDDLVACGKQLRNVLKCVRGKKVA